MVEKKTEAIKKAVEELDEIAKAHRCRQEIIKAVVIIGISYWSVAKFISEIKMVYQPGRTGYLDILVNKIMIPSELLIIILTLTIVLGTLSELLYWFETRKLTKWLPIHLTVVLLSFSVFLHQVIFGHRYILQKHIQQAREELIYNPIFFLALSLAIATLIPVCLQLLKRDPKQGIICRLSRWLMLPLLICLTFCIFAMPSYLLNQWETQVYKGNDEVEELYLTYELDQFEKLLESGLDPTLPSNTGIAPFDLPIKHGYYDGQWLRLCVKYSSPNARDENGQAYFFKYEKLEKRYPSPREVFVQAKIDPNLKDTKGIPLLMYALKGSSHCGELFDYLIDSGCDVSYTNEDNENAIFFANYNELKRLFKTDIDINLMDKSGWTRLMNAVYHKEGEVIELYRTRDITLTPEQLEKIKLRIREESCINSR